ncbi:ABC-2 type transport system permease protein [Bacillus tianshenii]|uniref:Transport permease protein n=1 Tax=Sutcliffiella tianshenii TaxID=1463404 RepID=A0ABS2P2W7_9BACI|nr:ABC transporter permease [Bacillus tianshenii]MBM7621214.1 ABC-2 type transport system permease protein [Bacillus tianshenii]
MGSFNQFKKMFSTHLKLTIREKQAWFWGIFFPVILMVVFMVIFTGDSDDEFSSEIAIVNEQPNPTSDMVLNQIKQIEILDIKSDETVSRAQAEDWVKEKEVDAAIILPESADATSITLIVNKENEQGVTAQALSGILDKFIQQANLFVAGATPTYEMKFESISSGSTELSYTDFLLTGMIALAIAQGGMFGMIDLVEMRRKGLLKRLRMTPANMGIFGLSDMTMRLLFSIVQIILLSLIGVFVFGANLYINFLSLLVVFLIGALTFNALGYFFSSFSKTTEAYMGMANIVNFLMMFLSGVFFPVETMPGWLQPLSNVLPLTHFAEALRQSMAYETSLFSSTLWLGIGTLVLWGVVAFTAGALLYKRKSIVAVR